MFAEACVIFFTFDMHNFTKAVVLLVASFLISCELSAFAFEKRPYSAALLEKAKQGDAKSQVGLGLCYERGEGVPEDKVEAVKWYCKAAEQGYAEGQFNLGYCYDAGVGVPEDNVEAVKWYRKAAEQGHVMAQYNLGSLIHAATKDNVEAVKWIRKAAEQGHVVAQFSLALSYEVAQGVPQDKVEAVKWYRKAAEQGHVMAQTKLGICYAHGEGVPQDKVEAYALYNLASVKNELARNFRDSIAKEMTPDQITAAEKRTLEHQKEFKHN